MNPVIVTALIAAGGAMLGAVIGAFVTLYIQSRKLPSDIRLTDAQTEKVQHETATGIIQDLREEVKRLKTRIDELEARLTRAEVAASNANEFRRATIVLGEKLDRERVKVLKLAEVISGILACVEDPARISEIKRGDITRLVASIVNGYPAEVANG